MDTHLANFVTLAEPKNIPSNPACPPPTPWQMGSIYWVTSIAWFVFFACEIYQWNWGGRSVFYLTGLVLVALPFMGRVDWSWEYVRTSGFGLLDTGLGFMPAVLVAMPTTIAHYIDVLFFDSLWGMYPTIGQLSSVSFFIVMFELAVFCLFIEHIVASVTWHKRLCASMRSAVACSSLALKKPMFRVFVVLLACSQLWACSFGGDQPSRGVVYRPGYYGPTPHYSSYRSSPPYAPRPIPLAPLPAPTPPESEQETSSFMDDALPVAAGLAAAIVVPKVVKKVAQKAAPAAAASTATENRAIGATLAEGGATTAVGGGLAAGVGQPRSCRGGWPHRGRSWCAHGKSARRRSAGGLCSYRRRRGHWLLSLPIFQKTRSTVSNMRNHLWASPAHAGGLFSYSGSASHFLLVMGVTALTCLIVQQLWLRLKGPLRGLIWGKWHFRPDSGLYHRQIGTDQHGPIWDLSSHEELRNKALKARKERLGHIALCGTICAFGVFVYSRFSIANGSAFGVAFYLVLEAFAIGCALVLIGLLATEAAYQGGVQGFEGQRVIQPGPVPMGNAEIVGGQKVYSDDRPAAPDEIDRALGGGQSTEPDIEFPE